MMVHSDGVGLGSVLVMALPASVMAAQEPVESSAPLVNQPTRSARRVLIIDDNTDAAASLAMLLEISGNEVLTAKTGEEGLAMARLHTPTAIVVDIGLPGINGYQVAEALRREPWGRDVLLIALTGWGQAADKEKATAAGFNHHRTKPADVGEVQNLIAAYRVPSI